MSSADVGAARSSGTVLADGRYRLVSLIASGGMGRVWRARDEELDRQVAVKELMPPPGASAADRRDEALSSMAEARAAARIEHPGVVRVYDVLRTPGRSWIVMEFVESRSLQERLLREGPLPHREAARIGVQVLQALRAAHSVGVLHLDVKPHNILLARDGRIMLTDFGLAMLGGARPGTGTPLLGSPYFIAPERLRDRVSDTGTDLWSLGATLYAMVEGRPPFKRANTGETLRAVLADEPDQAARPGPVHEVVAGLLVKDPALRLAADDTEAALRRIAEMPPRVPVPRRPAGNSFVPGAAAVPQVDESPTAPIQDPPVRSGKKRRPMLWIAALSSVAVTAAAVTLLLPDDETGVAPPPVAASVAPPVVTACGDAARTPVATRHRDSVGFQVTLPAGWSRSTADGVVCLSDPQRSRSLEVRRGAAVEGGPLAHWENAERTLTGSGALPGYQKVSMGVLLMTGGGADWEYTWQPPDAPRQHVHRYLWWASAEPSYEVSWSARDDDWAAALPVERAILGSFTDPDRTEPTWAVPSPR